MEAKMYHIANDKRAKKSADLIADGLLACLQEQHFENITISDLNRKSYVSRSTFYRLFDNTMDVVSYLCDRMFENLIETFSKREWHEGDNPIIFFFEEIMKHNLLIDILQKGNRVDILYETHLKYNRYFYKFYLDNMNLTEDEAKYVVGILSSSLCSIITTWSAEGKKDTAEELYRRVQNSFRIIGIMYGI